MIQVWLINSVKIFRWKIPYLTKGPYALFYGDSAIIPLLSSESAGRHFTISYLVSLSLLLSIFMLKKLIMRKLPTQQRLKELVVGNFLSVFSLLIILATVTCQPWVVAFHFQTINENSKSNIKKTPVEYWKDLLIIATGDKFFKWPLSAIILLWGEPPKSSCLFIFYWYQWIIVQEIFKKEDALYFYGQNADGCWCIQAILHKKNSLT